MLSFQTNLQANLMNATKHVILKEGVRMTDFDNSIQPLSDEETEAQVFRELEAAKKAFHTNKGSGVIVFEYPDKRTFAQRLRAWWYFRQKRCGVGNIVNKSSPISEPEWPRHWATTKYI